MSQETDDVITISLPTKPGSDLASKLLLQNDNVIHTIVNSITVMPKVIVFAIKGFSSKAYLSEFTLENGYYTLSTAMWAQTIRIYTIDSIADLINEQETLKPTVALSYFLCSQEKSIISLDLCDDEEMKKLYSLTNEIFSDYVTIEESASDLALDVIDKTGSQFSKILSCAKSSDQSSNKSMEKIIAYAKNGVDYTSKKRKIVAPDTESPILFV